MRATALLKPSLPMSSPTSFKRLVRGLRNRAGIALRAHAAAATPSRPGAASEIKRHSRCTKRCAPSTPASVQITSRSGGESDSMNQRAVSAP